MAHVKNHDYHILNPSLWPFIGAVAAFVMLFGAVLFFHDNGPWLLLIGFVGVLYVMFGWWADTVTENKEGDHTPVVLIGLRYGFILFILQHGSGASSSTPCIQCQSSPRWLMEFGRPWELKLLTHGIYL